MEMHQVRYFLAVCELLNFTRAAERCNVSQPALTRAVKKLEDELGGPLFRRERNLTHLSDLGRMMKPHLEQSLAGATAAMATAQDSKAWKRRRSIWRDVYDRSEPSDRADVENPARPPGHRADTARRCSGRNGGSPVGGQP